MVPHFGVMWDHFLLFLCCVYVCVLFLTTAWTHGLTVWEARYLIIALWMLTHYRNVCVHVSLNQTPLANPLCKVSVEATSYRRRFLIAKRSTVAEHCETAGSWNINYVKAWQMWQKLCHNESFRHVCRTALLPTCNAVAPSPGRSYARMIPLTTCITNIPWEVVNNHLFQWRKAPCSNKR